MTKEKGRRLNAFDIAVVVILAAALGAGWWYLANRQVKGDSCEVVFTVEFTGVDQSFVDAVIGAADRQDEIKDSVKGYYLGKAQIVEAKPDTIINFSMKDKKFIETEVPGKYAVYLTVVGNGVETETALMCEGQPIRVGAKMSLKGKGYAQSGYVTQLYAQKGES